MSASLAAAKHTRIRRRPTWSFGCREIPRGNGFSAQAGDRLIASDDGLPAIFDLLQSLTDEAVTRGLRDMVAIHSGVVAWNGCAALLPGASHAGKTTLVTGLLKRGAVYSSDEYALLGCRGPSACVSAPAHDTRWKWIPGSPRWHRRGMPLPPIRRLPYG